MLIAEDHSGWHVITEPPRVGGLGFDATWFAEFYHHLIGDTAAGGHARLLRTAGFGDNGPLPMDAFAGVLAAPGAGTVVYHESHDEAGNSGGSAGRFAAPSTMRRSRATRDVRRGAVARVAAGMTLLSAGTPMFFMGEEIGAQRPCRYDKIILGRRTSSASAEARGRSSSGTTRT